MVSAVDGHGNKNNPDGLEVLRQTFNYYENNSNNKIDILSKLV